MVTAHATLMCYPLCPYFSVISSSTLKPARTYPWRYSESPIPGGIQTKTGPLSQPPLQSNTSERVRLRPSHSHEACDLYRLGEGQPSLCPSSGSKICAEGASPGHLPAEAEVRGSGPPRWMHLGAEGQEREMIDVKGSGSDSASGHWKRP